MEKTTEGGIEALIGVERRRAHAPSPTPAGSIITIPLDLLDDNPFQHRTDIDPEKLEELAGSIAAGGLLQAISVRRVGDRWQIIAGHRRRAAFGLLAERAKTDEERQRWRSIPAQERSAVDDEAMERFGLTENLQRDDPSALDSAAGLAHYQQSQGLTVTDLAERLNLDPTRVRRLLRLNNAPEVVKNGVTKGIMVALLDEETGLPVLTPSGREKQEHRHLDLMAALEFGKLFAHLTAENPKKASDRTEAAVRRALTQNWGLRRIQTYVANVCAGKPEAAADTAAPAAKVTPAPWKESDSQITISKQRLQGATPEQRAELRRRLEELLG